MISYRLTRRLDYPVGTDQNSEQIGEERCWEGTALWSRETFGCHKTNLHNHDKNNTCNNSTVFSRKQAPSPLWPSSSCTFFLTLIISPSPYATKIALSAKINKCAMVDKDAAFYHLDGLSPSLVTSALQPIMGGVVRVNWTLNPDIASTGKRVWSCR